MARFILVNNCGECPYSHYKGSILHCFKTHKDIIDQKKILISCPLYDMEGKITIKDEFIQYEISKIDTFNINTIGDWEFIKSQRIFEIYPLNSVTANLIFREIVHSMTCYALNDMEKSRISAHLLKILRNEIKTETPTLILFDQENAKKGEVVDTTAQLCSLYNFADLEILLINQFIKILKQEILNYGDKERMSHKLLNIIERNNSLKKKNKINEFLLPRMSRNFLFFKLYLSNRKLKALNITKEKNILDDCPKCEGGFDLVKIIDENRDEWLCQFCGEVKRIVNWKSEAEFKIEAEFHLIKNAWCKLENGQ